MPSAATDEDGLFYIGISAGSMVAAGNFSTGLRYIENPVTAHCERETKCGEIKQKDDIYLNTFPKLIAYQLKYEELIQKLSDTITLEEYVAEGDGANERS